MQPEMSKHHNVDEDTQLDEYIKSIVKREGYITYKVTKRKHLTKGASYVGNLTEVDIVGKTENGEKETDLFIKQIVTSKLSLTFDIKEVFAREKFIYKDLCKELDQFQEAENVPLNERYKFAKVFDECDDETIIIENLAPKGFKSYYRMDVINLEYAKLAVKYLARLHGLSLAMKMKRPDYYEKKIKNMNCLYKFSEKWFKFTHGMCFFASKFLPEDLNKKVMSQLINIVNKYPTYMTDDACIKTVCHCDYRHNNIMVKEMDGIPEEVIAVDYQMTYFGNPVLDLIYFIFWGTDQQFRRHHLESVKQLYHQYLGTFLQYFSIDIEDLFPRKEFERQFQEKLDFGLMIGVFYLPFLFPPEDDVPKVTDSKQPMSKFSINVDDRYGERFKGIVQDFVEWGYL